MPLDDAIDDGQAQTRTLAGGLVVKKGSKTLSLISWGMPQPVSENRKTTPSWRQVAAGDGDGPGAAHGIRSVEQQIGKNLLELARISDDLGQLRGQLLDDFDIMKKGLVPDQVHATSDDVVDVQQLLFAPGTDG